MCPFKPCLPLLTSCSLNICIYRLITFFFDRLRLFCWWLYYNFVLYCSFFLYSSYSQWMPVCLSLFFFLNVPDSISSGFLLRKIHIQVKYYLSGAQQPFLLPLQYPFRVLWALLGFPALQS